MTRAKETGIRSHARRGGWLAIWALVLAVVTTPTLSRADSNPCTSSVPNCEPQVQAPITYAGWQTQGWAYYCSGDHPYFWGYENACNATDFSFDNSCFSVAENPEPEIGDLSKFDANITNWCTSTQSITVTLGCSDQEPRCPGGF